MAKPKRKIHIELDKELKDSLKDKARSLSISLSDFVRMVLTQSLKGELAIN